MPHPIHDPRYQVVAARLRELREARGWFQHDVADRLGRNQTFVSKYESGIRRVDVIELLDILRVLGADPHEFLDYVSAPSMNALPR